MSASRVPMHIVSLGNHDFTACGLDVDYVYFQRDWSETPRVERCKECVEALLRLADAVRRKAEQCKEAPLWHATTQR